MEDIIFSAEFLVQQHCTVADSAMMLIFGVIA